MTGDFTTTRDSRHARAIAEALRDEIGIAWRAMHKTRRRGRTDPFYQQVAALSERSLRLLLEVRRRGLEA